jgi:hypothetical protein
MVFLEQLILIRVARKTWIIMFVTVLTRPECWTITALKSDQPFLPSEAMVWPPLWYSGQSSCLQIQRSGFDFRLYQISWELVVLEQGPLSLMSTIKVLHERKSSGSGLESREYVRRVPLLWPRAPLYPKKLTLTSPTSGDRSVSIVRSPWSLVCEASCCPPSTAWTSRMEFYIRIQLRVNNFNQPV